MEKLRGWRTVIVNVLAALLPILELSELVDVLPPEWVSWYMLGLALLNIALRAITTTPVGQK